MVRKYLLRTPLHIASLLGDDGIIRVLLSHGADPCLVDKNLDTPIHLAARWCSREENYPNYKLVMTPLLKASPKAAYVENKDGETPQSLLNLGKERAKNAAEELRARENEIEEKLGTGQKKKISCLLRMIKTFFNLGTVILELLTSKTIVENKNLTLKRKTRRRV